MKALIFEAPREDRPMLALGLVLMAVSILSLQDALIKFMAPQTSFWQLQVMRSGFILCIILVAVLRYGQLAMLRPVRLTPAIARGVMLALCMTCFFGASQQITVTQMASGLYTYPLFVSLLAGPVLGEKIGRWRFAALALGAAGMLLVVNPFADSFTIFQIFPVFAGFFYACNILILRKYCRNERPLALVTVVGGVFLAAGLAGSQIVSLLPVSDGMRDTVPFILVGWPELGLSMIAIFGLFACLNLAGNLCLSRAYQTADSSWLAPLDYIYLMFAAMWGRVLFDTWPTPQAIAGMGMIAAAGIITAFREQRRQPVVADSS